MCYGTERVAASPRVTEPWLPAYKRVARGRCVRRGLRAPDKRRSELVLGPASLDQLAPKSAPLL